MDYIVWTRAEYSSEYVREDAGDLPTAKRIILDVTQNKGEAVLTVEVPFSLELKVGEPGGETKKPPAARKEKPQEQLEEAPKDEADQNPAK